MLAHFLGYIQDYRIVGGRSRSAVQFCLIPIPNSTDVETEPKGRKDSLNVIDTKAGSKLQNFQTQDLCQVPDYYRGIQTLKTLISRVCIFTFLKPQKNVLRVCGNRIRFLVSGWFERKQCSCLTVGNVSVEHSDCVGARSASGQRSHPRQNKRHKSLGSSRQDNEAETARRWWRGAIVIGRKEEVWGLTEFSLFW